MRYSTFLLNVTFIICLLLGIFLRFYNLRYTTTFDLDHENYGALPARKILIEHDFPVLGARTGVGNLYIAPAYSYLSAAAYAIFRMDPIATSVLGALISTFTIVLGYLLVRRIFTADIAKLYTLIWVTSPLVFSFENIPANANLLLPAALFVTIGLILCLQNLKKSGWLLVSCGLFLGINAHFTGLLLILIVATTVLTYRHIISRTAILAIILTLLGILPLLVFDVAHNFQLWHNFWEFVRTTSSFSILDLASRFIQAVTLVFETIARVVFFAGNPRQIQLVGLIFAALVFIVRYPQKRLLLSLLSISSTVYIITFSFYKGAKPDYYLMGILPVVVLALALSLNSLYKKTPSLSIIVLILVGSMIYQSWQQKMSVDVSLGAKEAVVKEIKHEAQNNPVKIQFDTDLGSQYGFNYLFYYHNLQTTDEATSEYMISIPAHRLAFTPDLQVQNIALAFPQTVARIYQTKEIKLYDSVKFRIPKEWAILGCPHVDFDKYLITPNLSATCASFAMEKQGMVIAHLPDCSLWDIPDTVKHEVISSVPLFAVPATHIPNTPVNKPHTLLATAFERHRCIVFGDLTNAALESFSPEFTNLTTSLKSL